MQHSTQQYLLLRCAQAIFHYDIRISPLFKKIHTLVFGLGTNVAAHRSAVVMSGTIRQAGRLPELLSPERITSLAHQLTFPAKSSEQSRRSFAFHSCSS